MWDDAGIAIFNSKKATSKREELEALQWLENNIEPFQTVSDKWKATTASRLANIGRTIRSQFERFKALKQPNGYSLIDIDFSSLHPGKESVLFNLWPTIADKLIKLVTAAKEKSLSPLVLELLRSASQVDASQELKNLCAFFILPFICPVSRTLVANNISWRPSASEVQRSFILLDASQVTEANDDRRKFCQEKGLSLQPYIVLVGPNLCSITARFVIIENIFYKVETILKAVDVCFKSFFVFNATYQVECEHIWLFVQRKVFEITTKYDNNFTRLEELLLKLQD
ncbi:hypothetical protein B566_EDAN013570 [Ephemera danica]|nr:hypothetical protein B566_EDAN013570 [Ephemera danica]